MNPTELKSQYQWKYPATLENVEQVCIEVLRVLKDNALGQKDLFAIELLVREAINNAFLHGCQQNPFLLFSCLLMVSPHDVTIIVSDEGAGFDWRCKSGNLPGCSCESGRGLHIFSMYANSIKYNDAGNCVTLTRMLNQGEKDE